MNKSFGLGLILLVFFYLPTCLFGISLEGKKQIVFIVNPISHEIKKLDLPKIIEKHLDLSQFEYKIVYTQNTHSMLPN